MEGREAFILEEDFEELTGERERDGTTVRLLPGFDTFLLGHKDHDNIVGKENRRRVYRPQGWVSQVVLLDGRAAGVWTHSQRGNELEVRVEPFSRFSPSVERAVRGEAESYGRFLGSDRVTTKFA